MRRPWFLLTLALTLCASAEAKPNWKRIGAKVAVAGAAAGVHAYGLHKCRSTGVEKCQAHYGAAWASFGAVTALNFVAIPLSEKIDGWQGNTMSYGGSAGQAIFGILQAQKGRPNVNPKEFQ